MKLRFISSIRDVDASAWNACANTDYPFLRHDFLLGLEDSGCTTANSGWQPHHCLLLDGDRLAGAIPTYLKTHSYGEYVFDWALADAWQRSGLDYYPKLVSAIPFTPCTGPRILIHPEATSPEIVASTLVQGLQVEAEDIASSWHVLFHSDVDQSHFENTGMHERQTCQFHWFNYGFANFDDFLATFSSRKRKNLKKERAKVDQQNIQMKTIEGEAITPGICEQFHRFYQITYAKRSGHGGYLTRRFFTELLPNLRDQVLLIFAYAENIPVAGALYFKDSNNLYGRYWGALAEFDGLHFEACYYQGIEYCIRNGLQHFDPGAQGEHKIQRGFEPTRTHSHHYICDKRFDAAVGRFCQEEIAHVRDYQAAARDLLPFKEDR